MFIHRQVLRARCPQYQWSGKDRPLGLTYSMQRSEESTSDSWKDWPSSWVEDLSGSPQNQDWNDVMVWCGLPHHPFRADARELLDLSSFIPTQPPIDIIIWVVQSVEYLTATIASQWRGHGFDSESRVTMINQCSNTLQYDIIINQADLKRLQFLQVYLQHSAQWIHST